MGLFRMMCRSVPCCRRHSSLLWTFLVVALIIYIVYSHVHPRNKLTQLLVDKLPAVEKGGFWGDEKQAHQQGGDKIQHGPFPGERWPQQNINKHIAADDNGPVPPAMPHEAQIDQKYLLDKPSDWNDRRRGDMRGFATQGGRHGFGDRFNRFEDSRGGFQRKDDYRFHDKANAFPRRGGWKDNRAWTTNPREQDSFRRNNQGRWAGQDVRGEDNRRGWVNRDRPRFPDEDKGEGQDDDHREEAVRQQDVDQDKDQGEDESHNLDKDQGGIKDFDNDPEEDQDQDQNQERNQDEDEEGNKDLDQDRDEDQDQQQHKDLDLQHMDPADRDALIQKAFGKGGKIPEKDQAEDADQDQNQDENEDHEKVTDLKEADLEQIEHADRVAAIKKSLGKDGKIPEKDQAEDNDQDQDQDEDQDHDKSKNLKVADLQHMKHEDRVAAIKKALHKEGHGENQDEDDNNENAEVDEEQDAAQAKEDMEARIRNNAVLRGPPDLPEEDRRPAKLAPPAGVDKEKEELPELDLNIDEVQRRRDEFEKRGGPETFQQGPGIVDAPPPKILTLQSWDLEKLEETFHKYIMTKQINCQLVMRAGKKQHGGWNVCVTLETRPMIPCLIYSFGFDTDFTFEDDVSKKYGCETHYFDPNLNSYLAEIRRSTGVTMHKYGLSDKNGFVPSHKWFVKTLATIKQKLRHTQPIDILKIDIEDNEWRSVPEMLNSGVMGQVRQLLVEFHILAKGRHTPTTEDYVKYLQVMRDLYIDGFRIAAVREDETELPSIDGINRAQNYEMLFLRIDRY